MNFRHLAAVAFIFLCSAAAWMILGATLFSRTYDRAPGLRGRVVSNWGGPHEQRPPTACYRLAGKETPLLLERGRAGADLRLEHRQKGLLWYSTYTVAFSGEYTFRNPAPEEQEVSLAFRFPSEQAIYDDVVFSVDGRPLPVAVEKREARATVRVAGGDVMVLAVAYRSQGLENWRYGFGGEVSQVRDFQLRVRTNFSGFDFAEGTLSPTQKRPVEGGWELLWSYRNLMTGQQVGLRMPEKLQPGPLAGQISFFAPVSLLFFFFVMLLLTALHGIDLHPINYFFLAAAFFAFHLLLAYLVDHISIHAAFVAASVVSVFLVVSYLRLVVGFRFAAVEAGSAQLLYLVLFSYAFFFEGFTGLAITIGSILTLFVAMQLTGRMRPTPLR